MNVRCKVALILVGILAIPTVIFACEPVVFVKTAAILNCINGECVEGVHDRDFTPLQSDTFDEVLAVIPEDIRNRPVKVTITIDCQLRAVDTGDCLQLVDYDLFSNDASYREVLQKIERQRAQSTLNTIILLLFPTVLMLLTRNRRLLWLILIFTIGYRFWLASSYLPVDVCERFAGWAMCLFVVDFTALLYRYGRLGQPRYV